MAAPTPAATPAAAKAAREALPDDFFSSISGCGGVGGVDWLKDFVASLSIVVYVK